MTVARLQAGRDISRARCETCTLGYRATGVTSCLLPPPCPIDTFCRLFRIAAVDAAGYLDVARRNGARNRIVKAESALYGRPEWMDRAVVKIDRVPICGVRLRPIDPSYRTAPVRETRQKAVTSLHGSRVTQCKQKGTRVTCALCEVQRRAGNNAARSLRSRGA